MSGTSVIDQPQASLPQQMVRVAASDVLDLKIDRDTMYIHPLPISNGSEDRQGERINPDGLIVAAHEPNPVVYYNHSHAIAPMVPPIGLAVTPDQKYNVFRDGDTWFSGCLFSQNLKFASQIFHLVCEGVIRGRSIGGLNHKLSPYKPQLMPVVFRDGVIRPARAGSIQYDLVEMYEWSWTPLPQNRDIVIALKSILGRGELDGQSIDPILKLFIQQMDLSEPAQVPGFTFPAPKPDGAHGMKPLNDIVAVTFAKGISPGQAKAFLRDSPLFHDTDLELDPSGVLKSVQVKWSGKTAAEDVEGVEGVQVLRALKCEMPGNNLSGAMPEGVEAMVAASPSVIQSLDLPEVLVQDSVPGAGGVGKPSARYMQTFVSRLGSLIDEASAALQEIENPKTIEECSDALEILGELQARLAKSHDEITADDDAVPELLPTVTKAVDSAEGEDGTESEAGAETDPAEVQKSMQANSDLFWGRRCRMPRVLVSQIGSAIKTLDGKDLAATRNTLVGVCKGLIPPAPEADETTKDVLPPHLSVLLQRLDLPKSDLLRRARGIV